MTTLIDKVGSGRRIPTFNYSEIFGKTFQGEGHYTGVPTAWIRFWGCNFNCNGFGQDNPDDPSAYVLDYEKLNPADYNSMEELPVFHRGCDSSYSWAQKFQSLARKGTASEIADQLIDLLPGKQWIHPVSKQDHHLAFTGGEPMMSQSAMVAIMEELYNKQNVPRNITIETNGTQAVRSKFEDQFREWAQHGNHLFWSVSPKLYLSGEQWDQAIQPDVVAEYRDIAAEGSGMPLGQLKYVANGSERCWDEIAEATELYREAGVDFPVWIMPVGADREMQESHQAVIAEQAIERGYNVSARVHTWVFGNVIGK